MKPTPATFPTVALEFERYIASVYRHPENFPPAQRRELKRAFFGAWANAMTQFMTVADQLPEDDACTQLDRWRDECIAFARSQ